MLAKCAVSQAERATRLSPDEIDSPNSYSSKRDMWHCGLLLVQMLFGAQSLWKFPNLQILLQHCKSGSMELYLKSLQFQACPSRWRPFSWASCSQTTRRGSQQKTHWVDFAPRTIRPDALLSGRLVSYLLGLVRSYLAGSAPVPISSPKGMFGTSPNTGLVGYIPDTPKSLGSSLSRYRADFEEVEFLVRWLLKTSQAVLIPSSRAKAASARSSKRATSSTAALTPSVSSPFRQECHR